MNIQELKNKKVGFVALGCAKNTVGLEKNDFHHKKFWNANCER